MKRIIIIAAGVAALALTGTSALAGGPIDGSAAGRETSAPNASATCNPFAATKPSDYLCRFTVHGSYFDNNSIVADGTYTGTITHDWSTSGTGNTNYNNEQCVAVSGTITYKRTGKSGALTTKLVAFPTPFDPNNGLSSMTCVTVGGEGGELDFHYMEDVTAATGYFHTAVKDPTGDYLNVNGYEYPSPTGSTVEADLGVNVY